MARFLLATFLSAFLLFQVQPLMGKYILPWFGGGPGVWTACMLFFQVLLLGGYGYAHGIRTRLSGRTQGGLHLGLLAVSLLFVPVEVRKPLGDADPTRQILGVLGAGIGVPYLLLSSTGPLLQSWFHRKFPERSPYRLYALSNAGSLLALLSYPFLVEPELKLGFQVKLWSWSYVAFVLLCGWCAAGLLGSPARAASGDAPASEAAAPSRLTILFWLALAACGSTLLLATTNQMCREVASVPFLWILPLALYLLTFLIVFDHERWYDRRWFALLVGVTVPASCGVLAAGIHVKLWVHVGVYALTLFACCMACHGELARSKPDPRYLTLFYVLVAAGGALGGGFVALAAPRIFRQYTEFHLALAACSALALAGWLRSRGWTEYRGRPYWVIGPLAGLVTGLAAPVVGLAYSRVSDTVATYRNFYGVLRVREYDEDHGMERVLTHGRIMHGFQYLDSEKRSWPTSYYGESTGVGLALKRYPRRGIKVGVIGLGVGTIATYGRPGDVIRFYEINPDVVRIAGSYFRYCKDSRAKIEMVLGDARIRLEQEAARGELQGFDVLVVDAFSSDSIPTHLLTVECFDLYRKHLKPDGLLLFHISNRMVDLTPVMRGLAQRFGWPALYLHNDEDEERGVSQSSWAMLASNRAFLDDPVIRNAAGEWPTERPPVLWTDDFASLWRVVRF